MASSLQIGPTPEEDVISQTEVTGKEPQVVAPPPPPPPLSPAEPVHTLDIEEEEEDLENLTAEPYEGKIDNYSDEDEEKEDAAPPFRPAGESATFGDFEEDDEPEDEDDALN